MATLPLLAQEGFIKELSDDGTVEVLYKISEGENGEQLVEYYATIIADVTLAQCDSVMKNAAFHKQYLQYTEESKKVRDLSSGEVLLYYYLDSPWPLPNSDIVVRMSREENSSLNLIRYTGVSAPLMYKQTEVARMVYSNFTHTFRQLEDGRVEFVAYSKFTPIVSAPDWLVSAWFPKGPIEMAEKYIAIAKTL